MNHCLYCDTFIQSEISWQKLFFPCVEPLLCKACLESLQPITGDTCEKCSRSLDGLSPEYIKGKMCTDCSRWEQDARWKGILEKNISLFIYNDFLKEILARYKFRGDHELAKAFAPQIGSALKSIHYDFLVPIPLSRERLEERGFNQSTSLATSAKLTTSDDLLIRIHSEKQSKKTRQERLAQDQIFQINSSSTSIKGKTILLIDDIYTTGSTLHQAAKTLKNAGAESIKAFTLARG
ncbi:ComF family protein [Bacillus sp. FJAT-49682]|uniref:ComF family protein n=1 Tax=Lederbergia citrea TaxID=2833581 RepID=A0A942UPK2_9BACI|nr:ComF family protein [Lederbergia citrea]MBS4223202.1 ComF family protein [Lederbergia citrea]